MYRKFSVEVRKLRKFFSIF